MIHKRILDKIVKTSQDFSGIQNGRCKHFSFLVSKNTIVGFGWNDYTKTHPIASKFGHYNSRVHSELACILSCQKNVSNCVIINTRIGNSGELMMAKPCNCCQRMLLWHNINNVIYSNSYEEFKCLDLMKMTTSFIQSQ